MFDVSICIDNNQVLGKFIVDSYFFEPTKYEYAFYLYKDGERIDVVWYTKSMEVTFDIENKTGLFFVKAFIKDIEQGNTRNYNSEKVLVE